MDIGELKRKLLNDDEFRSEYYKRDLAFEIGEMVIDARVQAGMTQEDLARKIRTKQPSVARLENGSCLPSIRFLDRVARALGGELIPPRINDVISEDIVRLEITLLPQKKTKKQ